MWLSASHPSSLSIASLVQHPCNELVGASHLATCSGNISGMLPAETAYLKECGMTSSMYSARRHKSDRSRVRPREDIDAVCVCGGGGGGGEGHPIIGLESIKLISIKKRKEEDKATNTMWNGKGQSWQAHVQLCSVRLPERIS